MNEHKNRRKFIKEAVSALALSSLAIPTLATTVNKGKKVKMLTTDGKLVEVDESVLAKANKKKADNKEIVDWVKPKS